MAVIGKEGVRVWFKVRCKLWPEGHDAGERGEGEGWGRGGATRVRARVTIRGSRSEGMAASFVGGRVRVGLRSGFGVGFGCGVRQRAMFDGCVWVGHEGLRVG